MHIYTTFDTDWICQHTIVDIGLSKHFCKVPRMSRDWVYHLKTRLYITIYHKEVSIPTFYNFAYFPSFFVFQTYIVIILKHVKLYTGEWCNLSHLRLLISEWNVKTKLLNFPTVWLLCQTWMNGLGLVPPAWSSCQHALHALSTSKHAYPVCRVRFMLISHLITNIIQGRKRMACPSNTTS